MLDTLKMFFDIRRIVDVLLGCFMLGLAVYFWLKRASGSRFLSTKAKLIGFLPTGMNYRTIIQQKDTGLFFAREKYLAYCPVFRVVIGNKHEDVMSSFEQPCLSKSDIGKKIPVRVRPGKNPIVVADMGSFVKDYDKGLLRKVCICVVAAIIFFVLMLRPIKG